MSKEGLKMSPDTSGLKKEMGAEQAQQQQEAQEQAEQQKQAYKKFQIGKKATSGSGAFGTQLNAGKGQQSTLGG